MTLDLKKYKYTKKLLNYSNASKCNSLLSTSGQNTGRVEQMANRHIEGKVGE